MSALDDTSNERITVVIADDHELTLEGLVRAVRRHPDLQLVAEVRDGRAALGAIEEFEPDVALVDVRMPGLDGIELCARVTSDAQRQTRVVVMTAFPTAQLRDRSLRTGAVAFLDKQTSRQELCEALVMAGSLTFLQHPQPNSTTEEL